MPTKVSNSKTPCNLYSASAVDSGFRIAQESQTRCYDLQDNYPLLTRSMYFISIFTEPCIGVCLHKKLLLAERLQAASSKVNERQAQPKNEKSHKYRLTPPRIEAPSTTTSPVLPPEKPCVGICHHYRTLGLPYPF